MTSHHRISRRARFAFVLAVAIAATFLREFVTMVRTSIVIKMPDAGFDSTIPLTRRATTVAVIRAIGNALPPRHDSEQTLRNLQFILENEPELPHAQRHWLVNRIANHTLEQQVIQMLREHNQTHTVLRFSLKEYAKRKYNFHNFQGYKFDYIHNISYVTKNYIMPTIWQHVEGAIMHDQTLYFANNNGARNLMIDIGRSFQTDWILPLDGNCFFTSGAYRETYSKLDQLLHLREKQNNNAPLESNRYAVIPMARISTDNSILLSPNYHPVATDEPQIAFHTKALARYNPNLRYGRRSKTELLIRLRVDGPWLNLSWQPWELRLSPPVLEPVQDLSNGTVVSQAGWVARLFSGNGTLELNSENRANVRTEGIQKLVTELDVRVTRELHNFSFDTLMFYNEAVLMQERDLYKTTNDTTAVRSLVYRLLHLAQDGLRHGPLSVTDKPASSVAPSGDPHDYFHQSPHQHWPTTLRNSTSDNFYNGAALHGTESSHNFDRARLSAMQSNVTVLSLAYYMTGSEKYGRHAAAAVRTWFIDKKTRMNPNMNYAQTVVSGDEQYQSKSRGLIKMKDLYFMLDAVRILIRGNMLTEKERSELVSWFRNYLNWLETSELGILEFTSEDSHGTFFDVQAASIAAFIDDAATMRKYLDRCVSRLLRQTHVGGGILVKETSRPACEHHQMFGLQAWDILARLSSNIGLNVLWHETFDDDGEDESRLCRAFRSSVPFFRKRKVCRGNKMKTNPRRWWPLYVRAKQNCPQLSNAELVRNAWMGGEANSIPPSHYDMPNMYHPHDGIAPFWTLGMPAAVQWK